MVAQSVFQPLRVDNGPPLCFAGRVKSDRRIFWWLAALLIGAAHPPLAQGLSRRRGFSENGSPSEFRGQTRLHTPSPENTGVLFTNALTGDAFLTDAVATMAPALPSVTSTVMVGRISISALSGGTNRLYRNERNWHFSEVELGTAACVGKCPAGAAFADVDGDGDLDLLVNGIGTGTRLFLNNGKGKFTEVLNAGLSTNSSATSMALADIDGDGDPLDLYVTHYIDVDAPRGPDHALCFGQARE